MASCGIPNSNNYNLRSLVEFATSFYKSRFTNAVPNRVQGLYSTQGLRFISSQTGSQKVKDGEVSPPTLPRLPRSNSEVNPLTPVPTHSNFPIWARWLLGSVLTILLPFWKQKWEQLKLIENEAESIVEGVDNVAQVVEKVATVAEKVSSAIAEGLPENDKLKDAALVVERVSKETAHDAHVAREFIHKVEDLKNDFSSLEKMVEPVIDKNIHPKSESEKKVK